jgi:dATP pyrophosphohydrolase
MVSTPENQMPGLAVRCTMVSVIALRQFSGGPQMLIARRAGGHYLEGVWSYIAGHIAAGETGGQAARRELAEETGLTPEALYTTSFCEQVYVAQSDCVEIIPAFVAQIAADAPVRLNPEHSAYRWVGLDAAGDLLPFGSQRDLLAHVQREFVARKPSPFLRIDPAGSPPQSHSDQEETDG